MFCNVIWPIRKVELAVTIKMQDITIVLLQLDYHYYQTSNKELSLALRDPF